MNLNEKPSSVSLSEVHRSVAMPKNMGLFKRIFAFAGPAYLISVGYMDPGNWATDLEGGARFGYSLIWVLFMSNLMAILLQTLAARMGIVTGRDLAQACRDHYPKQITFILWILCEIAIAACDLAEVLGTAIGLNLLFKVPLLYGVMITGLDTMLFLVIQHFGIRKMEAFILSLITLIGASFSIQVFLSHPDWASIPSGFVPRPSPENLYIIIGILGATVMPHNLYLHSALVQTRDFEQTDDGRRIACKYNLIDSAIALNGAFFVNAAILIVSAAVFFKNGIVVTEIQQAHQLLTPLLGTTLASTLFAVALISAGQSSTLTGTLAGQIVMEGFLQFKIRPVLRRLITRLIAIVPAIVVIGMQGEGSSFSLLILSQVILSLQLPFAVIPLIQFSADKSKMGSFAAKAWVRILAWISAVVIVGLNAQLVYRTVGGWIENAGPNAIWYWLTVVPFIAGCVMLLLYISVPQSWRRKRPPVIVPVAGAEIPIQSYAKIGVALDYGAVDAHVLSHARTLASLYHAELHLFHVVEGISGQLFGKNAYDAEAREDREHLENIANRLRVIGMNVSVHLGYGRVPKQLVQLTKETKIDLLIMGGHGHRGLDDILYGTSISAVRHALSIPVLVVQ